MTALSAAKTHLLDRTKDRRVSICGQLHPTFGTDDRAEMTCKHCRTVLKRQEGRK